MPFYRYCCLDCSFDNSVFVDIGKALEQCPDCNSQNIVKKLGKIITSGNSVKSTSRQNIDKFIKDSREDLDMQKDDLKGREK